MPIVIAPEDESFGINGPVDTALASQNQIGWLNFFRGFVSSDWGRVHPPIDILTLEDRRIKSDKFRKDLIKADQDYVILIWHSRNDVLHEVGSESLAIVHAASLNHSISQLYSLQSTFSPILQSYFTLPLADWLRRSPRQRKRWLQLARLATSHSSATGTTQQLLTTYFPHAPTLQVESSPSRTHLIVHPPVPPLRQQSSIQNFFCPTGA